MSGFEHLLIQFSNGTITKEGVQIAGMSKRIFTQQHHLLSPCGAQRLNGQAHRVSANPCRLS